MPYTRLLIDGARSPHASATIRSTATGLVPATLTDPCALTLRSKGEPSPRGLSRRTMPQRLAEYPGYDGQGRNSVIGYLAALVPKHRAPKPSGEQHHKNLRHMSFADAD